MRPATLILLGAAIGLISCSRVDVAKNQRSPIPLARDTHATIATGVRKNQPSPVPPSEIERLNEGANAPSLSREDRAKSIFALFANHIKVGDGPAEVHRVLIRTDWMKEAVIGGLGGLGGWIPIDLDNDDTVYRIQLFPDKSGWSACVIYFRLSGGREEEDGRELLLGSTTLRGNPKLMEFALCGPDNGSKRFTAKGVMKYVLNAQVEDDDESPPMKGDPQHPAAPDQLR